MTRVLVVAASVVMRAGLEAVLAGGATLEVLGAAPPDLMRQMEAFQPEVVLLHLESAEDLASLLPDLETDSINAALVVLLENDPTEGFGELLRSGVLGVLPAGATASEMMTTVEAAAVGLVTLHPDLLPLLLTMLTAPAPAPQTPTPSPLSNREIEVLTLLSEGVGNKAIARQLHISEHTVKFHIASIFSKLGVSSRTEAVTLGIKQGLILL